MTVTDSLQDLAAETAAQICGCATSHQHKADTKLIVDLVSAHVEAERAGIVDWLRREGLLQIDSGYDVGFYGGQAMHFSADQIEQRVHIAYKPERTGSTQGNECSTRPIR